MLKNKKKRLEPAYWLGYVEALTTLKKSVEHARQVAGIDQLQSIHWEGAVCIALALAQEKLAMAQEKLEKVVKGD